MGKFNPTIEGEIAVRSPGPAPMQNNAGAAAIGGITQAVKILGAHFGNKGSNNGPSAAEQNQANVAGFMNGVQQINAMEQQGGSPQQITLAKQTLLRNSVAGGLDFADASLGAAYKGLTGEDFNTFNTTAQDRVNSGEATDMDKAVASEMSANGKTYEEAQQTVADEVNTLTAWNRHEEQRELGAVKNWPQLKASREATITTLNKQVYNGMGFIRDKDTGAYVAGPKGLPTEIEAQAWVAQATQVKSIMEKTDLPSDSKEAKDWQRYLDSNLAAIEAMAKMGDASKQNATLDQNFKKMVKASGEANGSNPVVLAGILASGASDVLKVMQENAPDQVLGAIGSILKGGDAGPKTFDNDGVNVDKMISNSNDKSVTEAEPSNTYEGSIPPEWHVFGADKSPSDLVEHMEYHGAWANFLGTDLIKTDPKAAQTYTGNLINIGAVMSMSEGYFSKEYMEKNFPSSSILSNLEVIEQSDPGAATVIRKSILTGLNAQKDALRVGIDNELKNKPGMRRMPDGRMAFTKEGLKEDLNSPQEAENTWRYQLEQAESSSSKFTDSYTVDVENGAIYIADDHTSVKDLKERMDTAILVDEYLEEWDPQDGVDADLVTDATDTTIPKGEVKVDIPIPEDSVERAIKEATGEAVFPVPADRPFREDDPINASPKVDEGTAGTPIKAAQDLTSKAEGTVDEGYNTTFGSGKYTDGAVNLEGMTLGEVKALQKEVSKKHDHPASPMGKYQIVHDTLAEEQKKLGLDDSTLYTPEVQDKMFESLLKKRGIDDFKSGKITEDQMMTNMAKEFASFPMPNGKGYYDKDKDSRIAVADVRSMLKGFLGTTPKGSTLKGFANQKKSIASKIRNIPTSDAYQGKLTNTVANTGKKRGEDIDIRVISGSQMSLAEANKLGAKKYKAKNGNWEWSLNGKVVRTGSTRHDKDKDGNGNTADIILTRNGKDVKPADDPQLYVDFFEEAGVEGSFTGMGHYAWGIHVGGGTDSFWGPTKSSKSASKIYKDAVDRGKARRGKK